MKILITSPNSNSGGVASFVANILPFLGDNTAVFKRGRQDNRKNTSFLLPFRYIIALIKNRPKRVIINTSLSKACLLRDGMLVILSKLFCVKTLLIVHGFKPEALKNKFLLKNGYFRADSIVVLANEFKSLLLDAGYKRGIYTQFNPVEKSVLNLDISNEYTEIRDILFMSRIEKEKGIYTLLEAYKELKNSYSNIKLHVAGSGSELDNVKEYVYHHKLADVIFYGFVKGELKNKLLSSSDMFIFPSHREGLPISVLEAMSTGQVVITRPVGGLVDLYKQCNFGDLIDSLNPDDYITSFNNLTKDTNKLREVRGHNMRFAKVNFDPKVITDKLLTILNKL